MKDCRLALTKDKCVGQGPQKMHVMSERRTTQHQTTRNRAHTTQQDAGQQIVFSGGPSKEEVRMCGRA